VVGQTTIFAILAKRRSNLGCSSSGRELGKKHGLILEAIENQDHEGTLFKAVDDFGVSGYHRRSK
jgi:hypothetical protein